MGYRFLILAIGCAAFMAAGRQVSGQELPKPVEMNPSEIQWVWGEVVSVDTAGKSLTIKYLDYDTDEEKTMKMTVTDATTYQEIKGIDGIKASDTVSIEYTLDAGRNIAKDITVEKVEDVDAGAEPQQVPPEKVGEGPATEAEGPVQDQAR